jgi:hypothetical protein
MRLQLFLCIVLLILRLSENASFCSPVCGSGCDGESSTNCKSRCWSDGVWKVSGNTCIPRDTSYWAYFDKTADLGGSLTIAGSSATQNCGRSYYMSSSPNGPITVSTATTGITVFYYQLKWYVGIISIDVKCNGCGGDPEW